MANLFFKRRRIVQSDLILKRRNLSNKRSDSIIFNLTNEKNQKAISNNQRRRKAFSF